MPRSNHTHPLPASHLPGMEAHPENISGSKAAEVQRLRMDLGERLACALAGAPIEIVDLGDGPAIVNRETGELVEDEGAAFAALLKLSAEEQNHFSALLPQEGGGSFYGGSALWKSSLRLDPNHMETFRRRSRQKARKALHEMLSNLPDAEKMARRYGWKHRLTLKLLTLTMPHATGKSQLEETGRFNLAWALFRKREFWKSRAWGGVKGVEDRLTADGSHVHGHMLMLTRYLDPVEIREEWRECLDTATRQLYGFGLAEDCPVVLDIRQVVKRGNAGRPGACELDEATDEVCKYITKPSDFLEPDESGRMVDRETLIEICKVPRWPRMFELLGKARTKGAKRGPTGRERAAAALAALASIHRAYLTGGTLDLPKNLREELADRGAFDSDDDAECRLRVVRELKLMAERGPTRSNPPTWRELLGVIPFRSWLGTVQERAERGRKFRIKWLLDHTPGGVFVLFDGSVLMNPA